jgi:hypothetical protein
MKILKISENSSR